MDPLGPLSVRPLHAPKLLPWFLALRKVAEPSNFQRIARALAAINDLSLEAFEAMMGDIGLAGDIHKRGALTVYETSRAFEQDAAEWALKRSLGVKWHEVSAAEIRALEPGLAAAFAAGVMLEDWAHIDDPLRVVEKLRQTIAARGAKLVRGNAVSLSAQAGSQATVHLANGQKVSGQRLLVATGAWSAQLSRSIGDAVLLESERGYNTTLPDSASMLNREVIFAERKFVATPLSIGLRIGGAAEFAGLASAPNYQRSDALLKLARRYLPELEEAGARRWMGNRPATPDSLPVIGPSPSHPSILYAFGHGHLGLTQSASTARLIGQLLDGEPGAIDLQPFSIARFA
jgi:D-amino-acid dehydrogenase